MVVKVALQAILLPEPDGGFLILIPAPPGCFSKADTIEEAQASAVEAWLESVHDSRKAKAIRAATERSPVEVSGAPGREGYQREAYVPRARAP